MSTKTPPVQSEITTDDQDDELAARVFWEILSPIGYVPRPVRDALKATGFDNLLSMSAMHESDLEAIAEQYQLPMGHRRLMRVLSERINQIGIDELTSKLLRRLDRQATIVVKAAKPTPPNSTSSDNRDVSSPPRPFSESLVTLYRHKLQQNIASWLVTHGEVDAKEIEQKDIVIHVSMQDGKLSGSVICPFCRIEIKIYIRAPDADSSGAIANSNYIKHYNRMHRKLALQPKSPLGKTWMQPGQSTTPPPPPHSSTLAFEQRALAAMQAEQSIAVAAAAAAVNRQPAMFDLLFKHESSNGWDD